VHDAGHTIGTHSENHPTFFGKLPPERMTAEIDDGIAHVSGALADPRNSRRSSVFPACAGVTCLRPNSANVAS
jgi:peptidoglycan/xylan/chitin deacetylase (PgdA/CDA1 family)